MEANVQGLLFSPRNIGVDRPIFPRNKRLDLLFALHDDTCGDRLNASCAKTAFYIFPKEGAKLISKDTVKNTTCLLGVNEIFVDGARCLYRFLDRRFCNFIKGDAANLILRNIQNRREMPGDCFSFAVRVCCKEDLACLFCFLFQLADDVALAANVDIIRLEAVFDIDTETAFRQIADMTARCKNLIVCAKIAFDGSGFGGRLHNN